MLDPHDNFLKNGLANKLSAEEAMKRLAEEKFERKTVSFYRYAKIENPREMRDTLYREWDKLKVFGRTYVAAEGINAQISVPEPHWDEFVETLYAHEEFADTPFKIAVEEPTYSFYKLTIKIKDQIVADGLTPEDYDLSVVGKHLEPEEFNAAMESDDIIIVDMRNHYESRIGHFEGAICPDVDTFKEQLPMVKDMLKGKEDKKVLLYCTGGIRCEKASAYLIKQGFKDVNQLHGGIINYAHAVQEEKIKPKFKGSNFVFDDRRAERITDDVLTTCDQCGKTCDDYTNCANEVCNLLFIQCSDCAEANKSCCTEKCQEIAALPAEERREIRRKLGTHEQAIYKSRLRPRLQLHS